MKTSETKTTSSNLQVQTKQAHEPFFKKEGEDSFFKNGKYKPDSFFQPSNSTLIQAKPITGQTKKQAPNIQLSPLSDKVDKLWKANQDREAILNLLSNDDAFNNRTDSELQKILTTIFTDPNDLWLAQKVLNRQLGESVEEGKKTPLKLPIELFFFKGKSTEKALVIAGVHGSEKQGIEVTKLIKTDLASKQPYFNVILVPSLFPVNAKAGRRQGTTKTNRNFPERGKTLGEANTDKAGNPLDAENHKILIENQLLIQLMERYQPSRIISVHGTQYAHQGGVFSDEITKEPDYAKLKKDAKDLAVYMLSQALFTDPASLDPAEVKKLSAYLYAGMIQYEKALNKKQSNRDADLSVETAKAIAKDTKGLASLKGRYKAADILKKVELKFKKDSKEYKAAVESLKQNPAVAGNKLDQPIKDPVWSGTTPGGVSLGGYAPSHGISVFTVEPPINMDSSKYPGSPKGLDPGVKQVDRLAELQAYADAIRTILLGK